MRYWEREFGFEPISLDELEIERKKFNEATESNLDMADFLHEMKRCGKYHEMPYAIIEVDKESEG